MFWNYKVILDQCGSSRGHRIRDKRYIFIPQEVLGWQLSVPPLFPLHLFLPLRQGIRGQRLSKLLDTQHFKDPGSLLLTSLGSVIHNIIGRLGWVIFFIHKPLHLNV